jgi:hypothetical protein
VTPTVLVVIGVGLLSLALAFALWVAQRIDRLHRRADATWAVVDVQLVRRAGAALQLAVSGAFDLSSSLLVTDAALNALQAGEDGATLKDRSIAESELSRTLRTALGEEENITQMLSHSDVESAVKEMAQAWNKAAMARRFFNSAVTNAARLHANPLVRTFHLAGPRPARECFETDDGVPPGLLS